MVIILLLLIILVLAFMLYEKENSQIQIINTNTCAEETGEIMSLEEAQNIAANSECGEKAFLKTITCNSNTGTWYIDLEVYDDVWAAEFSTPPGRPSQEECFPICVIDVGTGQVSIDPGCGWTG